MWLSLTLFRSPACSRLFLTLTYVSYLASLRLTSTAIP